MVVGPGPGEHGHAEGSGGTAAAGATVVRLRSLHRVVDVELNESLKEQGVADVTVDSCGPLYKFDVTVTFAPATEAEAPRGSNSVPASLGGGS